MPVLVKICGLKAPETVDTALDAGADMIGLVFFARLAAQYRRAGSSPRWPGLPAGVPKSRS